MTFEITAKLTLDTLYKCLKDDDIKSSINQISECIKTTDKNGKLIAIFGNGGSAADAQHWSAELVCTYKKRSRRAYRSIALTTDTSILTAWSNDFEFASIFERQIISLGNAIGLAIGLSTSGKSENVLRGLNQAKQNGSKTCLICGNKGIKTELFDYLIQIPSEDTGTIQTITQVIYHSICQLLEDT